MFVQVREKLSYSKLEFLALKWACTEKFLYYLYKNEFGVFTDNNLLTYVLTSVKLDATGQWWVSQLANHLFAINYFAGTSNRAADVLSHIDWSDITTYVVNQVVMVHLEEGHPVTSFCYGQHVIPIEMDQLGSNSLSQDIDWVEEIDNDPVIKELKLRLSHKMKESEFSA